MKLQVQTWDPAISFSHICLNIKYHGWCPQGSFWNRDVAEFCRKQKWEHTFPQVARSSEVRNKNASECAQYLPMLLKELCYIQHYFFNFLYAEMHWNEWYSCICFGHGGWPNIVGFSGSWSVVEQKRHWLRQTPEWDGNRLTSQLWKACSNEICKYSR